MKWSELPLLDYIDIYEQRIDVYIHTKDKRMILVEDIQTNVYIDEVMLSVEHVWLGQTLNFMMMRDDFSYLEYRVSQRNIPKNDDFNSIDEYDVEGVDTPSELLREP